MIDFGTCSQCGCQLVRVGATICPACRTKLRRARARAQRKANHEAMLSLGLVRVRGALGGVYYE